MVRKTVTLVFCDVADSTPLGERLDPEALRGVWSRYHDTAREVLERHGGTIEKFVGDAVLGVFGIPVVHEDDALRAVRAAVELRDELARLNDELEQAYGVRIDVRTGINTGEVFAGDPAQGDPFATGDAVVVAQRLEANAAGGEILVGDATIRLVRDAVTVEQVPPLALKGKSEPVAAWRLAGRRAGCGRRCARMDSPLVGRTDELARLARSSSAPKPSARAASSRSSASPVSASRGWPRSSIASLDGADARARGPLPPLRQGDHVLAAGRDRRRLDSSRYSTGSPTATPCTSVILEAVGRAETTSRSDELYWAVRRLLETFARDRPVVVVLDDVQWAEPAFLDLVEYLAGWSRDAPILVCCLARTELAELRPALGAMPTIQPLALAA